MTQTSRIYLDQIMTEKLLTNNSKQHTRNFSGKESTLIKENVLGQHFIVKLVMTHNKMHDVMEP
jgi:hypothetical protein